MCLYRKSVFSCNHSQIASTPLSLCCAAQNQSSSSSSSSQQQEKMCEEVQTHGRSTIRIARPCDICRAKKDASDEIFEEVKRRMAVLREHLEGSYGECLKLVGEAGVKVEEEMPVVKKKKVEGESEGEGEGEKKDPVAEFLRMKRSEKHSHLMMLGGS
ncbi:hypothetical protein GGS20DRAFT_463738 [Poronia punctata]|nr:hypothetical protein GGS20DRAFT_463738 [Poronia punctata]